jgi:uncharacterized membrane protein YeiH
VNQPVAVPPATIASWSYLGVSILAGLLVFFRQQLVARLEYPVQWFDAIGLAFFAVAGTQKALLHGLDPAMAALLGMLTGIGGGMLRDALVREIPVVLRADPYALAALAGAIVVVAGHLAHISPIATAIVGGTYVSCCRTWPSAMAGICPRPRPHEGMRRRWTWPPGNEWTGSP